ncbi:hypothetical protein GX51_00532 [Blastomyces parvus]|uniref:Uncharacterized protein n=1 Tax=Blastomyces parvus TaxID=2060905 RepID=A0A2B7XLM0_9EURO|nr:hypothetical protein GX51_00532 [Blastomyces parvus]
MRSCLRSKGQICLADRVKYGRRLRCLGRKASERSSIPPRRHTVNIEYLNSPYTPGARIEIVEIATASAATLPDIKKNEGICAKLKRHVRHLFQRKDVATRDHPGDETNTVHQPSRSPNDPQIPTPSEKPNRRPGFAFLRKFFKSQTTTNFQRFTSSTSLDLAEQHLLCQNSHTNIPRYGIEISRIGPFITCQPFDPSIVSTADLDLKDWASLTAFRKSRLTGAKQTVACQMSPSAIRTGSGNSDSARRNRNRDIQSPRCNILKWLEEIQEPPCLRRVAAVENLRAFQASQST